MKSSRLGLALGLTLLTSCTLFASLDGLSGEPEASDASASPATGPDATTTGADAAVDGGGTVAPGTVAVIAREADRTAFVAVDRASIYWWSFRDSRIVRATKENPGAATTLVARPGQTVSAIAVDVSGVYWVETGPDDQQAGKTNHRVMKVANGEPPGAILRSDGALQRLVVDATRIATTSPTGVETVTKSGTPTHVGVGLDQAALTADGVDLFYTFGRSSVFRLSQANAFVNVVTGVTAPREIVADTANLYFLVTQGGNTALVRVGKTTANGDARNLAALTSSPSPGPTHLALENDGLAWASSSDGAVGRVPKQGGASVPIASGPLGLNALAADADGVYWSSDSGQVVWARR